MGVAFPVLLGINKAMEDLVPQTSVTIGSTTFVSKRVDPRTQSGQVSSADVMAANEELGVPGFGQQEI